MLSEYLNDIMQHRADENFIEYSVNYLERLLPEDENNTRFAQRLFAIILNEEIKITDNIYVNTLSHTVYKNGKEVPLTKNEEKVIELLAMSKCRVLSYEYIIRKIWGYSEDNSILKTNVCNIRKKLDIPIISIKGLGYSLKDEP